MYDVQINALPSQGTGTISGRFLAGGVNTVQMVFDAARPLDPNTEYLLALSTGEGTGALSTSAGANGSPVSVEEDGLSATAAIDLRLDVVQQALANVDHRRVACVLVPVGNDRPVFAFWTDLYAPGFVLGEEWPAESRIYVLSGNDIPTGVPGSIATDETLEGDGTAESPLRIAQAVLDAISAAISDSMAAHTADHPVPTTRDARNEAAGTAQGLLGGHTADHPVPTTRDARNEAAGTAQGLLDGHTADHPVPTTRDARNEAAGTAQGLLDGHTADHPVPTTRDARNEAAGTAQGIMDGHTAVHPAPTTRDARNEAAGTAQGIMDGHTAVHPAPTTRDARNEAALGNPDSDGKLLSSTAGGVRSWVTPPSGGGGTAYARYQRLMGAVDALFSTGATGTAVAANCCWRKITSLNTDPAFRSPDGTLYHYSNGAGTYYVSATHGTPGDDYFSYSALVGNFAGAGAWAGQTLAVGLTVPMSVAGGSVVDPLLRSWGSSAAVVSLAATNLVVPTGPASLKFSVSLVSPSVTGVVRLKARVLVCGNSEVWSTTETVLDVTVSATGTMYSGTGTITLSGLATAGQVLRLELYRCRDLFSEDTLAGSVADYGGEVWFE